MAQSREVMNKRRSLVAKKIYIYKKLPATTEASTAQINVRASVDKRFVLFVLI